MVRAISSMDAKAAMGVVAMRLQSGCSKQLWSGKLRRWRSSIIFAFFFIWLDDYAL